MSENNISEKSIVLVNKFMKKEGRYVNGFFHNSANTVVSMDNDIIVVKVANKKVITATPDKNGGYTYMLSVLNATAVKRISALAKTMNLGFDLFWHEKRPHITVNNKPKAITRKIYTAEELVAIANGWQETKDPKSDQVKNE